MRRTLWSRRLLILLVVVCPMLVSSGCSCSSGVDRRLARGPRRSSVDEEPPAKPAGTPAVPNQAGGEQPVTAQPEATKPGIVPPTTPAASRPAASNDMPAVGADKIEITPIDPEMPLSVTARREQTITRLKKIGLAIGDFVQKNGEYPAPAIYRDNYPQLSWRVSLLPFLGHSELYQEFHLNEPWNSEHNKTLLGRIPPVFQSPERGDERTNYLLVTGAAGMFAGTKGPKPAQVTDGLANTAMLVEVDDAKAVPWTQPVDYIFNAEQNPRLGLSELRDDGFFVVFANASLYRISPDVTEPAVRTIFTRSGQESLLADTICMPAIPDVDADYVRPPKPPIPTVPVASLESVKPLPGSGVTTPTDPGGVAGVGTTSTKPGGAANVKERLPVPDDEARKKSQALFREIFRQDFENAKKPQQKYELAKQLVEHIKKIKDDPTGRYVVLQHASGMAADVGDVTTALAVTEQLITEFEVKAHDVKCATYLRAAEQPPLTKADNDKLILVGEELVKQAMFDDNYSQANEILTKAISAARKGKERRKLDDLADLKRNLELARIAYAKVEKVVDTLQNDPEDASSNLTIGKYMCFIKHNWERGLPMLALGNDDGLKRLAREELKQPVDPNDQTKLADQWWDLADLDKDKDSATKKEMYLRAVHWYLAAAPRLPAGLVLVKAEVRIKDAERAYGKEAVESLRLAQKVGS